MAVSFSAVYSPTPVDLRVKLLPNTSLLPNNENRTIRINSFIENQPQVTFEDRLEPFIRSRSISRDVTTPFRDHSLSQPSSDHHMSVDRTPDPVFVPPPVWRTRSKSEVSLRIYRDIVLWSVLHNS